MIIFLGYVFMWLGGTVVGYLLVIAALAYLTRNSGMEGMAIVAYGLIGYLVISATLGVFAAGVYWSHGV